MIKRDGQDLMITKDGIFTPNHLDVHSGSLTYDDINNTVAGLKYTIFILSHEFIHFFQRTGNEYIPSIPGKGGHNEREFLAYYFLLFPNDGPLQERTQKDPTFNWDVQFSDVYWDEYVLYYYKNLSPEKQKEYEYIYNKIMNAYQQLLNEEDIEDE